MLCFIHCWFLAAQAVEHIDYSLSCFPVIAYLHVTRMFTDDGKTEEFLTFHLQNQHAPWATSQLKPEQLD